MIKLLDILESPDRITRRIKISVFLKRHDFSVDFAGIAQLVEHNLAKVGVASSSLVSRSKLKPQRLSGVFYEAKQVIQAGWQSGYAAACKAVDAGSIPTLASTIDGTIHKMPRWRNR